MATPELITALQTTELAGWIRGDQAGSEWIFPIVETLHVVALATVFGSIAMVDLRLLGVSSRHSTVSKLATDILPWTWIAFLGASLTGGLMFLSKAETYYNNFETRMKFLFMGLAALNMLVFHFGIYRSVERWDSRLPPPFWARFAGFISLGFWTAVIVFGRWIGFST